MKLKEILIFTALVSPSFDFLSLPSPLRFTIGEIIFIIVLLLAKFSFFKIDARLIRVSIIPFFLVLFHSIISVYITGIFPSLTFFIRPFVYIYLSLVFCSSVFSDPSFLKFLTRVNLSAILKNILLFYAVVVVLQAFKIFPPLPIFNPSYNFNSLSFRFWSSSQPTGFTLEPSFLGSYSLIVLSLCLCLQRNFSNKLAATSFVVISSLLSGSRTGFIGSVLLFFFSCLNLSFLKAKVIHIYQKCNKRFIVYLCIFAIFSFSSLYYLGFSRLQIFFSRLSSVIFNFPSAISLQSSSSDASVFARSLSITSSLSRIEDLIYFTGFGFNNSHPYIYEQLLPFDALYRVLDPTVYDGSLTTWFQLPWDYGLFFFLLAPFVVYHLLRILPPVLILGFFLSGLSLSLFNFFWSYLLFYFSYTLFLFKIPDNF